MHAERPNELIHWDYLFMGASTGEDKYILVIKDDPSKYVWFFAVPEATADTTYTCLMDWFSAFGVCLSWVSDQGTPFKNEVIAEVPRCFRSLLSEWRLSTRDWPRFTKVVQLALNHTPAKSLGDHAPVTVMTGLPATSPLDAISLPVPLKPTTLSVLTSKRQEVFDVLRDALDTMHKSVVKAVSSWIFTVKNLITGDEREVHASRLKFYSDATLDVSEDLLHHIAHNSEDHVVAEILDSRYSESEKRFELLVSWRGLSNADDAWEPAATLLEDIPVM
ncbi:Chromodomain protein, partial [Phytophthora megakarya]